MEIFYNAANNYSEVCGYSKKDAANFAGIKVSCLLIYDELPDDIRKSIAKRNPMSDGSHKSTSNFGMAGYYGRSKSQGWGE